MGLVYEKEGGIAKVGLDRPKEKNALDPQILMDMHGASPDAREGITARKEERKPNFPGRYS